LGVEKDLWFFNFPLLFLGREEVGESIEVFLHNDANALGVQRRFGKIAIIRLVVHLESQVAIR
jgi:hypothetical protein